MHFEQQCYVKTPCSIDVKYRLKRAGAYVEMVRGHVQRKAQVKNLA